MNVQHRILSRIDRSRLYEIGDAQGPAAGHPSSQIRGLNRLLNHADFVEASQVPSNVVTMNSRLRVAIRGEAEPREITIVYPEDANPDEDRVSILTPMAQALLGARVAEVVFWQAPMGEFSARVEALLFQPEAQLHRV